ncbi:hypothetical protein DFP72DRAFT_1081951 [Ephemerocybe angulata]|uniref:Uncharacterized protein n=1 Tax=Ephemerocybe angulata TaxID=980116 RepID=A0A8H6LU88_9AGAR|nr:hypothetical protein DFP72DRAFT_1081951 [Tulosesus angulatus]
MPFVTVVNDTPPTTTANGMAQRQTNNFAERLMRLLARNRASHSPNDLSQLQSKPQACLLVMTMHEAKMITKQYKHAKSYRIDQTRCLVVYTRSAAEWNMIAEVAEVHLRKVCTVPIVSYTHAITKRVLASLVELTSSLLLLWGILAMFKKLGDAMLGVVSWFKETSIEGKIHDRLTLSIIYVKTVQTVQALPKELGGAAGSLHGALVNWATELSHYFPHFVHFHTSLAFRDKKSGEKSGMTSLGLLKPESASGQSTSRRPSNATSTTEAGSEDHGISDSDLRHVHSAATPATRVDSNYVHSETLKSGDSDSVSKKKKDKKDRKKKGEPLGTRPIDENMDGMSDLRLELSHTAGPG